MILEELVGSIVAFGYKYITQDEMNKIKGLISNAIKNVDISTIVYELKDTLFDGHMNIRQNTLYFDRFSGSDLQWIKKHYFDVLSNENKQIVYKIIQILYRE